MKILSILLLLLALGLPQAQALTVKQLNAKQLIGNAACIVSGEITDATADRDVYESGYLVKYFTLKIKDHLKGTCGSGDTLVFKQVVGVKGLPEYTVGKSYLLFLPEATETGLVAPVGVWQGRYELIEGQGGQFLVPSGKRLAREMSGQISSSALSLSLSKSGGDGEVDYSSLKQAIEQIAQEAK